MVSASETGPVEIYAPNYIHLSLEDCSGVDELVEPDDLYSDKVTRVFGSIWNVAGLLILLLSSSAGFPLGGWAEIQVLCSSRGKGVHDQSKS